MNFEGMTSDSGRSSNEQLSSLKIDKNNINFNNDMEEEIEDDDVERMMMEEKKKYEEESKRFVFNYMEDVAEVEAPEQIAGIEQSLYGNELGGSFHDDYATKRRLFAAEKAASHGGELGNSTSPPRSNSLLASAGRASPLVASASSSDEDAGAKARKNRLLQSTTIHSISKNENLQSLASFHPLYPLPLKVVEFVELLQVPCEEEQGKVWGKGQGKGLGKPRVGLAKLEENSHGMF